MHFGACMIYFKLVTLYISTAWLVAECMRVITGVVQWHCIIHKLLSVTDTRIIRLIRVKNKRTYLKMEKDKYLNSEHCKINYVLPYSTVRGRP